MKATDLARSGRIAEAFDSVIAAMPEPGDAVTGTPGEITNKAIVVKMLVELGRSAMSVASQMRREEDPDYLLNQVFLPNAVNTLFNIARKSKNTELMTNMRRLMASMPLDKIASVDPKTAYDMLAAQDNYDEMTIVCKWQRDGWYIEVLDESGESPRLMTDSEKAGFPVDVENFGKDDEEELKKALIGEFEVKKNNIKVRK